MQKYVEKAHVSLIHLDRTRCHKTSGRYRWFFPKTVGPSREMLKNASNIYSKVQITRKS